MGGKGRKEGGIREGGIGGEKGKNVSKEESWRKEKEERMREGRVGGKKRIGGRKKRAKGKNRKRKGE